MKLIYKLNDSQMHPEDRMWAANWILNVCEESQLVKIAKLAEGHNRWPSPKSKKIFVKSLLEIKDEAC